MYCASVVYKYGSTLATVLGLEESTLISHVDTQRQQKWEESAVRVTVACCRGIYRGSRLWQMAGVGEGGNSQMESGVLRKLPGAGCGWNIKGVVLGGIIK